MPREDLLPEEESSALPEETQEAPPQEEVLTEEPALDDAAPAEDAPAEEEPLPAEDAAPKPRPVRMAHCLWRGWWLAVCILSIAVLMGRVDAFGIAWRHQPWRAFGGAVAVGGLLGALPGLLRRDLPERPTLRRCLLGLFIGLIWGVLG